MLLNSPSKYVHLADTHNLNSPSRIVPILYNWFNPRSVVDIGCGIGTFLHEFRKCGVEDVLGIDGPWVDKSQLYIPVENFVEADLEKPISIKRKYDLVLCLEVVEHLSPDASDEIVRTLANLGNTIIFSGAVPNQGGQNHLNEQTYSYWQEKFAKHNFYFVDAFRNLFWNDDEINWWYRQNMFLVIHESIKTPEFVRFENNRQDIQQYIHPTLYNHVIREKDISSDKVISLEKELKTLLEGKASFAFYLKLILKKLKGIL